MNKEIKIDEMNTLIIIQNMYKFNFNMIHFTLLKQTNSHIFLQF